MLGQTKYHVVSDFVDRHGRPWHAGTIVIPGDTERLDAETKLQIEELARQGVIKIESEGDD